MSGTCILIPSYNDGAATARMVERLEAIGYPLVVVDDGSNDENKMLLEQMATRHTGVTLHRRLENGGKGMAVMDGLRLAHKQGYSHALQIDGDEQHRIDDIPRFLEMSAAHPESLVLGVPIFPDNTPKGRLLGRQISIFFVRIETLSGAIRDPLFGFRVYPLSRTVEVLERTNLGGRMDFDPEVAVRLYWAGLDVVSVETPVTYHANGHSSFHMVKDNLLISGMHVRLCLGMLWRAPKLIVRRWFHG